MMNKNERLHALKILVRLIVDKASLSQLMPPAAEISPMTKEICFGFCRHYFRLQAIANHLMKKRPKEIDIWVTLLIGLYQLHYMNQPEYAVVKETVALLEKIKRSWAKGLVNAVLRNFCRQKSEIINALSHDPLFIYGQPLWLLERIQKDWPENWQETVQATDTHPPMTLRVNLRKSTVDNYLHLFKQEGIEAHKHPIATEGITLVSPCDVKQLPGFTEGYISVQDGAAQLAASLLSLKPDLRLLDACCAPGGKTCHALELEPNLRECVALDVDPKRLNRVQENLDRLGLQAKLIQGDASTPEQWWDGQPFERILLDAPCSATGVIRRHADIKLLRTENEIANIIQLQEKLLNSLWPLLTKGGIMIYATCSIMAAENEQQIASFTKNHPDSKVLDPIISWGHATGHGRQILPGEHGMDGFFYAVLLKH